MRIATVVGTRPEIVRLSRVLSALERHLDHVLIHTGQNYDYELNQVFFDDLELRNPDYVLETAGASAAATIGNVITQTDEVLAKVQPDALLVLGDTNSCMAAIAAKRRRVPVFHMEAGNRCFDDRVPEEINRRIVDHISDINMPYSDISREYLIREGLSPDRIVKTGSPMYEVLHHYLPKIGASDVLSRMGLRAGEYFVLSVHREENIDSPVQACKLLRMLAELASAYRLRIIFSAHPRTRKRLESLGAALPPELELSKPLAFCDYVHLQMHARATLSDSGTITEESSILNFPALNLREAHERPEGMEEGAVMMTGFNVDRILAGLRVLESQGRGRHRTLRVVGDYRVPNVSGKVLRIILSYTDYVNRVVWRSEGGQG